MGRFSVAFFSDPPVASWAVPELLKQKIPLSSIVTVLPRVTRNDPGEDLRKFAQSRGVSFFRPQSLSSQEFLDAFKATSPSVIATMSFLTKIPKAVLDVAPYGGVNAHPALLPKYRGAIPFFWVIFRKEKKTGVTIHEMTQEFDAGDIYYQEEIPIAPDDTTGTLALRCYAVGLRLLIRILQEMQAGKVPPKTPQHHKKATYAPLPDATILEIDWNKPAEDILALVRAASPFFGAFTFFRNVQLKIWSATLSRPNLEKVKSGTVVVSHGKLEVAAADSFVSLEVLQLEMLRFYSATEFLALAVRDGEILGRRPL
jgi:methionyl-tRNA formyltransferase